mmetsp:Transcript_112983/g.314389  ORF Transcript_112983/g.314389 Transcript_112983/m.314389 type:complete len:88 (-) Transcript_112983:434-697(-)
MVRIVNGEIGGSLQKSSRSPLDKVADFFWGIIAFFVLFFQSMFSPKGGAFKPAKPDGKREVRRINPGGSSNTMLRGTPPGGFMGGGG